MEEIDFEAVVESCVRRALQEDLGSEGDLTTRYSVAEATKCAARIVAKAAGVIAGLPVARAVFLELDPDLTFTPVVSDGDDVGAGVVIARLHGHARALLTGERTALNFLQRLSGIATLTSQFVNAVQGTGAKILDTRKTAPGLRILEKYAVRKGGGSNHRFGLFDMILIKENHSASAGGLQSAVDNCRRGLREEGLEMMVVLEVHSLEELDEALDLEVDRILLDNMSVDQLHEAVARTNGRVPLEASGGVSLESVQAIAATGVQYISAGVLTHSAPAVDLSMLVDI